MKTLAIELRKEKRTGVIPVLLAVGVLGAAYAFVNFIVRKDTLLNLPLAPMDVLLTQLYGVIMVLNLFGIVVATCMIYNMEFKGSAVKKMYMLPVSVPVMYLCKFLILTVMFLVAIVLQNLALAQIGMTDLPDGAFEQPLPPGSFKPSAPPVPDFWTSSHRKRPLSASLPVILPFRRHRRWRTPTLQSSPSGPIGRS